MHIFDYASDQPLILRNEDANLPKLGVIVENQNLIHALWQQLEVLEVTVITDASCQTLNNTRQHALLGLQNGQKIAAKLIIAADGVNSWIRQETNIAVKCKDFHQTAIVANLVAEKPHQHIARQWFAPHDVLALLPLPGNMVSIVWSVSTEKAAQLLLLSAEALAQSVLEQTKGELGDLKLIGKTQSFALNQQTAMRLIAERVVVVGDAAHQIHPMAGQGVNLGFRDVMQLSLQTTKLHKMQDVGDNGMLRQYERARKMDIATMNTLTTGLDYLFASDSDIIKKVTNWGLQQLNHLASIKKILIQQVAG
jgi:ubiquinone biosynthesis UbiH/UbiF/VisC/COQ6 family hydroxylase